MITDETKIVEDSDSSVIRDRAIRLFQYLRELSEMRTKTIRTLDQYEDVMWLSDIPQAAGCHCVAWHHSATGNADIWVEITKPVLLPPPSVPDVLRPWMTEQDVRDSSGDMPDLAERIVAEEISDPDDDGATSTRTVMLELADRPDIQQAWEAYMESSWLPWAEHDKPLQQVQRIYTRLFSLYQQQQRLGEAYEVLLGAGYLTWRTPNSQVVKRHIITAQIALSFDAARGKIAVGPAAEGAKPELEQDMLEADERPDANELRVIEGMFVEMGDAIWEEGLLHTLLKAWIHTIPNSREYDDSLNRQQDVLSAPQIHFAPAIILRKRTERSLVRAFKEICEQLENKETPVPKGISDIVRDPDTTRPAFADHLGDATEGTLADNEVYFPLPANDKQAEIAHRIRTHQGVLVQGPPGTGKSHTIANLVCHLLASGKRVLVTSHTPRALNVLRHKFTNEIKEIAPLCVMALSDDAKSMKDLETSVQGIISRYTSWDAKANDREIATCKADVDNARQEEARILKDLRAIREAETYRNLPMFGGYEGTLQAIARRVHAEEAQFNWLVDKPKEEVESPLTDEESLELLSLMRYLNPETVVNNSFPMIDLDDLIPPSRFTELVRVEREAQQQYDTATAIRERPEYNFLSSCDQQKRDALVSKMRILLANYEVLAQNINPWVKDVALRVLAGQERAMVELHSVTESHLSSMGGRARVISERTVSGLGDKDRQVIRAQASALLEHLEAGGKLRHWTYVARPKVVKDALYLVDEVCVNGRKCSEVEPLQELLEWINFLDRLDALDTHWCNFLTPPSGTLTVRKAEYENYNSQLNQSLELRNSLFEAQSAVADIVGLRQPIWHKPARIAEYIESAEAVSLEDSLHKASESIDAMYHEITTVLNNQYHEVVAGLAVAVQRRDESAYSEVYQSLVALIETYRQFIRMQTLLLKLTDIAPVCHDALLTSYRDDIWDTRLAAFTSAWNWSRVNRWMSRMSDPKEQKRLQVALEHVRQAAQDQMAALASAKAWQHCMARLSEAARQHLQAWQLAISAIGHGFGIHANRHRHDARMHLEQCRSAIPAWVMPIYRVAETVEMSPDIFDVVIVDEASQSGPEALFLQFLAKTIVVVGDAKQIKPQFVGMDKTAVNLLRQRLIPDLPHSDRLEIEHSFFDQARIRYASPICLQEHFRCMPEIIQFCNNLCYQRMPLIPLKQYGAGRLFPTIQAVHVEEGYQKGQSPRITNPPEADAIVERIIQCCADPAYEGKTMGVISLLGEDQAKLIESILLQRLGPEEMAKRRIDCGNAYAFQGDERDVMFLSMVSSLANGDRIGTLTSDDAEKRFNVAVSRAKEQMWLFHSATLNDLVPNCLRYRLLEYCTRPTLRQTHVPGGDLNVEQLRIRAATADRRNEQQPPPFDSWFEVDVFLRIQERGYRVLPQLPVAGYSIDSVVEGMRGRLAVECDGDKWHGPERYEMDMARQRQLERSGFPFWRVRGSVFYRNPELAMESLWATLRLHGISASGNEQSFIKPEELDHSSPQTQEIAAMPGDGNVRRLPNEATSRNQHPIEDGDQQMVIPDIVPKDLVLNYADEESVRISALQQDCNGAEEPGPVGISLNPYVHWVSHPLPDPRSAELSEIAEGLVEIVKSEGPMLRYRAYSLYARSVGIQRIRHETKSIFNRAMRKAINSRQIVENDEFGITDQMHKIVRVTGSHPISIRMHGSRTIEEIPPNEIASVMQRLIQSDPSLKNGDRDRLFRNVLNVYELVRMTSNTRATLDLAYKLCEF